MSSATQLRMYRGDTPRFKGTVRDRATQALVDLTGYTIWMTAKLSKADADPGVFQLSTTAGSVVVSNQTTNKGEFVATPLPANTNFLTADTLLFVDIQIKSPGGLVDTVVSTTLLVELEVTRTS